MITEDYVSFETAKLLREKGFDEPCHAYWHEDENRLIISQSMHAIRNFTNPCFFGPAVPTLQMVMRWLREVHNLHCDVGYDDLDWFWNVISVSEDIPTGDRPKMIVNGYACNKTYEQACEAAIKYCLENLI